LRVIAAKNPRRENRDLLALNNGIGGTITKIEKNCATGKHSQSLSVTASNEVAALNDLNEFRETLARHRVAVPGDSVERLHDYCQLVWQINKTINLTRHSTYELFVTRDVLDSVQVATLLEPNEEILDIGSGGGVPGLLLAILRPDVEVSVCDSVGKRADVLETIVSSLELSVPVYSGRAETVLEDFRFSSLTARAVGPMAKILTWLAPHWASIGRLLLIKGPKWVAERGESRHRGLMTDLELRRLVSYPAPGRDADSVILSIQPKRSGTNDS